MKRRALWWIAWLALAPTLAMAQATNSEGRASNFGKTNPQPAVQAAPNATTITPDASTADQVVQTNTQAGGTLTVNAPLGSPTDGQRLTIRVKCTNVQTFAWNAIYRASSSLALTSATTGGSKTDYFGFNASVGLNANGGWFMFTR